MDKPNIVISFGSSSSYSSTSSSLTLEQVDAKQDFEECMEEQLKSYIPPYSSQRYAAAQDYCLGNCKDEKLIVKVKARPCPFDLNYSLEPSIGSFSEKTFEIDNFAKSYDIRLEDHLTLDIAVESAPSAGWEGNVYNIQGERISPPVISWDDEETTFIWNEPVVGVIRVSCMEKYYMHLLEIPKRNDSATTSAYDCTVLGFYENNVTTLNVDIEDDSSCIPDSVEIIDPDDDEPEEPTEMCIVIVSEIDYCTGEVLDEWEETIMCEDDS